jgi:hypothetical protein
MIFPVVDKISDDKESKQSNCNSIAIRSMIKSEFPNIEIPKMENTDNPGNPDNPWEKANPLVFAARDGRMARLELLLSSPDTKRDPFALICAAGNGHLKVVERLIQEKNLWIDPDVLVSAAEHGQAHVVRWLLYNSPRYIPRSPWALYWAIKNNHDVVIEILTSYPGFPRSEMTMAAMEDYYIDQAAQYGDH